MISIGVVFYNESVKDLNLFFDHLLVALRKTKYSCEVIDEIIFVQNSKDVNLNCFLSKTVNILQSDGYKTQLIQNTENNIGLARKIIIDKALSDWVYFTDPDVYLDESVFIQLHREAIELADEQILGITGSLIQTSNNVYLNEVFKTIQDTAGLLKLSFQGAAVKIETRISHAPTAHLLLKKSIVRKIGNFSTDFATCGEDLDLTHRASQQRFLVYFGSSHVLHNQNFKFLELLKKSFSYGQAQAKVISKNGFCSQRIHRVVPAFIALVLLLCTLAITKTILLAILITVALVFFLKRPIISTSLFIIIYGMGTVSKFILELYSGGIALFFGKRIKKSFQ